MTLFITDKVDGLEGIFKVRRGAFVTKKGAATFEGKVYASFDEVVQTFLKELYDLLQDMADPSLSLPMGDEWQAILKRTKAEPAAPKQTPATSKLLTMEELKSTEAVAAKKGYKVGTKVYEKSVGQKEGHVHANKQTTQKMLKHPVCL